VKRALPFLAALAMASTLTGCMSIYKLPPGKPSATLEVNRAVTAWICAGTPAQRLSSDRDGHVAIPAGERITIGANYSTSDGYMNYMCSHSVSLVPIAGAQYLQDFETEGQYCNALVYAKTDDKRVGLAMDPTLYSGGPGCTE